MTEKKWDIKPEDIKCPCYHKMYKHYTKAKSQMNQRTSHHELYGLIAKNKSVHQWSVSKGQTKYFSEGSTQYIMRKTLADTIQRMPDGELQTPYDKASVEHILSEYIFRNKVMWSEDDGIDMLSNLTNSFKMAFIYGFAPVRIGFEKDYDSDVKVSFNLEQWNDVFINPDCMDIRKPAVVYHRQYISRDDVYELIDKETGVVHDPTYNADTLKYIIENNLFGGGDGETEKLGDQLKGVGKQESIELITEYRRGSDEFITYFAGVGAEFRRVKNYDPRKEIPWVFCVLEPDPDWPLGLSQVEFLLGDQQFNDLFQTSAYKNLLLAMEPPIMVAGWETNPSSYRFEPRKIWNLGNNPNNVKVEPVKIDNSIVNGWSNTREAVAASMLRNLNVMDGTIANDAGTGFSKTAPGVEQQQSMKNISINQYAKRMEYFISAYANKAMRMYINALGGTHEMIVDEDVRRRLADIGRDDLIHGTKVDVDFDILDADLIQFQVRTGSLVELKEDQERAALTEMVMPFVQNLNGFSDENRTVIENEVIIPVAKRMLELSDSDISQTLADSLSSLIAKNMMAGMQEQIDGQQMQLDNQQMQIDALAAPEGQPEGIPGGQPPMPPTAPPPPPGEAPMEMPPPEQMMGGAEGDEDLELPVEAPDLFTM